MQNTPTLTRPKHKYWVIGTLWVFSKNHYLKVKISSIKSIWDQDFLSSIYFILFPFYSHQFYFFPTPKIVNVSQREHRFSFSWLWVSGSGIKILISIDFLTKERNIGWYIARCQKSEKTGLKLVENCILIRTFSLLERLKHMGFIKWVENSWKWEWGIGIIKY